MEVAMSKRPMEIAHCVAPIIDGYFCIPSASSRLEVSSSGLLEESVSALSGNLSGLL